MAGVHETRFQAPHHSVDDGVALLGAPLFERQQIDIKNVVAHASHCIAHSGMVTSTVNDASSQHPNDRGGATSRQVTLDGLTLHVQERSHPNDRPSVLLVHGLASNARLWDGAADALVELGYHVIAVDQRGHGRSDKPDEGYDMQTVADDLASLITALQLERPVVAGQSWGGNVVIELSHRHPHLVRGVCAVDGGLIQLRDRFDDWESCASVLAPPALAGTQFSRFEAMIRSAYRGWPETAVHGTLANMEVLADGTIRPWLSRERHMKVLRGLWDHSPQTIIPTLSRPVLFTPADSGTQQSVTKRDEYDRAATQHHVRVDWFSPAHHDLHAQYPERWANVLHAHISGGFLA